MIKDDIIERIIYSLYLEELQAKLTGRIDKFILLLMFIFGSNVVFNFYPTVFGVLIVILTGIQGNYRFGETSAFSLSKQYKYQKLFTLSEKYSDDELLCQLLEIEREDKTPWSILKRPAILLTQHKLYIPEEERIKLTNAEKFWSFFAGGHNK